jgi:oxygen-independent coproporphyrinogen-3 oxidase
MYEWSVRFLQKKGYHHYEISNFARPGYECQHNLNYWRTEDYIGLGPGAVSCLEGVRNKNIEDIIFYSNWVASGKKAFDPQETEILTREQLISETMMLALRTAKGIDLNGFQGKFKVSIQDIYGQILANYIEKNVLFLTYGRLKINPDYYFIANAILQDFMI